MVKRTYTVAEAANLLGIDMDKLSISIPKFFPDFSQRQRKRLTESEFDILSQAYSNKS